MRLRRRFLNPILWTVLLCQNSFGQMTDIVGGYWIPWPFSVLTGALGFGSGVIDASEERVGSVVRACKAGAIRKICFRTNTVTTGATVDVRLETVDTTTGKPSGTLFGTTTNGSQVIADANDNVMFCVTLTADATVALNSYLAVVIANPTASFGNMQIANFPDDASGFNYTIDPYIPPATGAGNNTGPVIGFEYSDGSYCHIQGVNPISLINTVIYGNTSTPDVRGLRFRLPVPKKVCGWSAGIDFDGDGVMKLFDSDGATIIGNTSVDSNVRFATSSGQGGQYFDEAPISLLASTYYRAGFEPAGANTATITDFDVLSAAALDSFQGGQDFHYTSAKDPNEESDWTQVLTKRPAISLLFCGADAGDGASTIIVPGAPVGY